MSTGAQGSSEQNNPQSSGIINILYNNTYSDDIKISLLIKLFRSIDDKVIRGVVLDNTITIGEKSQILNALHRLEQKTPSQDSLTVEPTTTTEKQSGETVKEEVVLKSDFVTRKKAYYESLDTEYNAMILSAQKKADAFLDAQMQELEASFQSKMSEQQREIDEELRQYKLVEIESILDEIKEDKKQLNVVMQGEVVDDIKSQLNFVKARIFEAEQKLEAYTQKHTEAPVEDTTDTTTPTTPLTDTTSTERTATESVTFDTGILPQEAIDYVARSFGNRPITSHRSYPSAIGKYYQVNINNGEYYATFDQNGGHLWTNGPFEFVKKKMI